MRLPPKLQVWLDLLMTQLCKCRNGVQGKQQGMETQPKDLDNPTQVLPYPQVVWCD